MSTLQTSLYQLAVALSLGLLIGLERGWSRRDAREGERIAGLRTFGLIGLLGGGAALLAGGFGALLLGLMFLGLCVMLATVYAVNLPRQSDAGITSLVAALLTFVLGALAGSGEPVIASASAIVAVLLLSYKPLLHRWVSALERQELDAAIKLLLISVVLLPILPNRGFGPWQALNPFVIWWMVVLIAAISFVGYFAMRIGGAGRGVVFTALAAGLASSTALTLHFSRLARSRPALTPILSAGILLACSTMFPRMWLVAGIVNPALFRPLLIPALVMVIGTCIPALVLLRRGLRQAGDAESPLKNPLELGSALTFGVVLSAVMLLGRVLTEWFGDAGVLALAAASGVADVDAITLSLARMGRADLSAPIAVTGMVIAAAVNSLVKAGMSATVGGGALAARVAPPLLLAAVAGLATVILLNR